MLIGIIGENCSGKSTLAAAIRQAVSAEIIREKLLGAVSGENLIYVISEPEQIRLLPEGAVRILVRADLDSIKERFRLRMRGNLPAPVEKMLESKHGMFDSGDYDYCFDGVKGNAAALCDALKKRIGSFC